MWGFESPIPTIIQMEKRSITLIKKKVRNENKQHKLEVGEFIEVLAKESGELQTTKAMTDDIINVRYFKNFRFILLPITYIEL